MTKFIACCLLLALAFGGGVAQAKGGGKAKGNGKTNVSANGTCGHKMFDVCMKKCEAQGGHGGGSRISLSCSIHCGKREEC
jgi:hypothetical protein